MTDPDAELYARWRGGERQAGKDLFRRHAPAILRFFRSKLPANAEDLTQEVFARFLRPTTARVSVRPFLFGIARNVLREELRRRRPDFDEGVTSIADLGGKASTQLHARQRLLRALQSLPTADQIAIELHYWEGLSCAEIGAVLGVSASGTRSRLDLARDRLAASLTRAFRRRPATDFANLEQWAQRLREVVDGDRGGHDDGDGSASEAR